MSSIPTTYNGIRFRSRLEAKWAHVFTQLGWRWSYEPLDLNGWIPDFIIKHGETPLLVDVKPDFELQKETTQKIERAIRGREREFNVFITRLEPDFDTMPVPVVGWITDWAYEEGNDNCTAENNYIGLVWDDAGIIEPYTEPNVCGLSAVWLAWHDRITGKGGGKAFFDPVAKTDLRDIWNRATNALQWKAPA